MLKLAPDFPEALRRLSYVELELGEGTQAILHARRAHALEDNPYNRAAVARALASDPTLSTMGEALSLAVSAHRELPDDPSLAMELLYVGLAFDDDDTIDDAITALLRLAPDEAPELWALTADVARRVGTRPIEAIYITPGTEIAVTEQGGLLRKLRGRGQRCLILGLGVLPALPQRPFKAILAHEYGHFSNRDTGGGNLALQVRRSIFQIAHGLAVSGQAHRLNPVWLFLRGFYHIYLRITLGASRLQEILADRYAALAYGTAPLVAGLRHVVRQSLLFEQQAGHEVEVALQMRRGLQNLYTLPLSLSSAQEQDLEQDLAKEMSRPTSAYDSHPAMHDRIALLEQLDVPDVEPDSVSQVVELLPTLEQLQHEMTAHVQARLR